MKLARNTFIAACAAAVVLAPALSRAQIFPTAEISPDPLEFADTRVGATSDEQNLTVTKMSGQLPVYIFTTKLGNTTDFSMASDQCYGAVLENVGDSCVVRLVFSPQSRGHFNTTFSVISLSQEIIDTSIVEGTGVEPAVTLSTTSIDFGPQTVDKPSAAYQVTMLNPGNEALAITSIAASDNFGVTDDCGSSLAVDASCTINVTFTPTAVQSYSGTVTITDDASDSPQTVELSGSGIPQGQPDASLSRHEIDFGNQLVNTTSAAQEVTLTNSGTVDLTINSITASADFGVTDDCGGSLAADDSCTISITFTPPTASTFTGTVLVDDDASDSPQSISLDGVGVPNSGPQADLSVTTIDFGQVGTNRRSNPQVVTITNVGDEDLIIDSVTISGDNPDVFYGVDDCESDTLQPSQSCSGAFTFYPKNKGIYSAVVSIADNSADSPQLIVLSGTGIHSSGGCDLISGAAGGGGAAALALAAIAALLIRRR